MSLDPSGRIARSLSDSGPSTIWSAVSYATVQSAASQFLVGGGRQARARSQLADSPAAECGVRRGPRPVATDTVHCAARDRVQSDAREIHGERRPVIAMKATARLVGPCDRVREALVGAVATGV